MLDLMWLNCVLIWYKHRWPRKTKYFKLYFFLNFKLNTDIWILSLFDWIQIHIEFSVHLWYIFFYDIVTCIFLTYILQHTAEFLSLNLIILCCIYYSLIKSICTGCLYGHLNKIFCLFVNALSEFMNTKIGKKNICEIQQGHRSESLQEEC